MPAYLIYGKVIKPGRIGQTVYTEPQKTFRALNWNGARVTKLSDAFSYASKKDAQDRLDKVMKNAPHKDMVEFQIRKA